MINYNDFLILAEQLVNDAPSNDSAEVRSSISRAYYYVFHSGRERFRAHPKASFRDGPEDHRELIDFLRRIGKSTLSDQIRKFRERRNTADYDLNKDFNKHHGEDCIKRAKRYASAFSNIPSR